MRKNGQGFAAILSVATKTAGGRVREFISLHDCDDEVLRVEGLLASKAILKKIVMILMRMLAPRARRFCPSTELSK